MGMGSAQQTQQPQAGMSGKGGSQTNIQQPQQPQVQQPAQGGVAGKGGVARPDPAVFNSAGTKPGMTGKGGSTYPFPNQPAQPQVQPPQAGMGGKGVGQSQIDPNVLTALQSAMQGQATQPQQAGLAGKGLGQTPQQPAPGMGGKGGRITPDVMSRMTQTPDNFNNPGLAAYKSIPPEQRGMTQDQADRQAEQAYSGLGMTLPQQPSRPALTPMTAPVKPVAPVSNPANVIPAPDMRKQNPQQLFAEAKRQQVQRQIQQLAAAKAAKARKR